MPELPEVEVVRKGLDSVIDLTLNDVWRSSKRLRFNISAKELTKFCNKKLSKITRVGKYLVWHFEGDDLISHLGMSGKFRLELEKEYQQQKHDHLTMHWSDNSVLIYNDVRRFGGFITSDIIINQLGIDAISEKLNAERIFSISRNKHKNIRELLCDQKNIAGIGNIYISEILWFAGVSPHRVSSSITFNEAENIVDATKTILHKAIEAGGSTIKDFAADGSVSGYFQLQLNAYGKGNKECTMKGCKGIIIKEKTAGRYSYFCDKHQV